VKIRLALAFFWLLHLLPLGALAALGNGLGRIAWALAAERRRVALVNLRLCFPELAEGEREAMASGHFRAFVRAALEESVLWFGSRERIRRMVQLEGLEHLEPYAGRKVILFIPHFVGLSMAAFRFGMERPVAAMYSRQKNREADRLLVERRTRFGTATLISRQDGVRAAIRAMRAGVPLVYLPDQDFGPRDTVFVPFFGVPAATVTGLARIARIAGAVVVPYVPRQLPGAGGYVARLYPAWEDFPGEDVLAATRRMNAFIEERVREMPEQYFWTHKRFKTRPEGEPKFY